MDEHTVGMLHPGAMGSVIGRLLGHAGHAVVWAADGRSDATRARADEAGLDEVRSVATIVERADTIISLCPPAAAHEVAREVADFGFDGTYVDANAIGPGTARTIGDLFGVFVDGSVVGGPPVRGDAVPTRLYLAGTGADDVAALFHDDALEVVVLDGPIGAASALKMAYAGWTKTATALAVALRAMARAEGVEEAVLGEWDRSVPALRVADRSGRAGPLAAKAWRYTGEMDEIAGAMAAHGLPDGFHRAAAAVFDDLADLREATDPDVDDLLARLLADGDAEEDPDRSAPG